MDGEIKTYLPEKKYGFIKGNDGKDYYFHTSEFKNKSDIPNICEEAFVEFDQKATPKGYKAVKCTLVDSSDVLTYVVPAHFLTSKTNQVKGWQILEYGEWVVKSSTRESADVARQEIIDNAQHVGANALIDLNYSRSKGSESSDSGKGTYHYSIHNFRGRIATVAKKNAKGIHSKEQLLGVNTKAALIKDEIEERIGKLRKVVWLIAIVLSLAAVFGGEPILILAVLGVVIYINYFWISFGEWLEKT